MGANVGKTPKQSEALDREINRLDLCGYSGAEIAARLGMSRQAVHMRLKKLNARTLLDRTEYVKGELRVLDAAMQEALAAWERSKDAAITTTVETTNDGEKHTKKTEGQSGNPAHLANAIRISESRRRLLGLDAPTKNIGATLTPEQLAAMSNEELEALYAKLFG